MKERKKIFKPQAMKDSTYLMSRIDKSETGCWLWNGPLYPEGYGRTTSKNLVTGKVTNCSHRVSYEIFVGEIPAGKVIDHLCRVRNCINPEHLEAVSNKENVMRSHLTLASKNSAKTHCPKGHEYTVANTSVYAKKGFTERVCKTCQRAWAEIARTKKAVA